MGGRYLITGGAGFIGSYLSEALLRDGSEVIAMDNLSTGRHENIAHLEEVDGFQFVHGSVLDELMVEDMVQQVDTIIHLAAAVGVKLIVEHPLRSLITNIRGSELVLAAAHRYRRRVLIASTSEIYGKNSSGPLHEEADRVLGSSSVARWAYSTSKAVDEILAFAYQKERELPTIIVRLFNTVGPRQTGRYGMVLPRFVERAVSGRPLLVYGDGSQKRCFCHVADVVRALVSLMEDPRAEGNVFNIGGTEEVTILDLAKRVIEIAESPSEIEFIDYKEAYEEGFEDMERRVPDITRIERLCGWHPRFSLDEIISEVVGEYRALHSHV